MAEGAKLLMKHISANNKIFVPIDSDCDGFTSAALFINYLNRLFPHWAQTNIIYKAHQGKEHGIIESAVPADVKLVVAIDSSSNDYEVHENLSKKGIEVLVLDHHEADKISEYACVINNQLCDYPNKFLSGVGIAYQFCRYLDSLLGTNHAEHYEDLVALGLTADMMDLREFETMYLIKKGLMKINNPYFSEMVKRNYVKFENGVTPFTVAFYVAPFINAINRTGSYQDKILLFESLLDFKAYQMIPSTKKGCKGQFETLVEQAGRTSINVKNAQKRNRDAGRDIIEKIIKDKNLLDNKILIIPIPEGLVDKNLSGLIANELASEYQRPVLILREVVNEGVKSWEGSARSYGINNFKDLLAESGLVMYAQGHQGAFGVGILDILLNSFISWTNEALKDISFDVKYNVDFIYDAKLINGTDILELAEYADIWGQNIDEPLVVIKNIKLNKDNLRFIGNGKTLRIDLPKDKISLIKFNIDEDEKELLTPNENGVLEIEVVGTCQKNVWMGYTSPQIAIKDYDIVKRVEYYF